MVEQTVTLEALQDEKLEDLLQRIVDQQTVITVLMPDGNEIVIEPKRRLKPLPVLEGTVPFGWKRALYDKR